MPLPQAPARNARRVEHHHLIEMNAARSGARLGGGNDSRSSAQVNHNDLVAKTVHLEERGVCEGAHGCTLYGHGLILAKAVRWPSRIA
jgi:hypothetical protein